MSGLSSWWAAKGQLTHTLTCDLASDATFLFFRPCRAVMMPGWTRSRQLIDRFIADEPRQLANSELHSSILSPVSRASGPGRVD